MSDEIAILRDGRLVQSGAPGELYDRPRTRFVADFLGKSNFLAGLVDGVAGDGFAYAVGPHRFAQAGARAASGERALVALRPEKLTLSRAEPASANRVAGKLAGWSYLGTAIQFRVKVDGIGELAAVGPAWKSDIPLEADAPVWVGWDADASIRVAED